MDKFASDNFSKFDADNPFLNSYNPEVYSGPFQMFKMKFFVKLVNVFKSMTIFTKTSVLDALQCPKYTSVSHTMPSTHFTLFYMQPVYKQLALGT